jgi:hypothetical protein
MWMEEPFRDEQSSRGYWDMLLWKCWWAVGITVQAANVMFLAGGN